jgi:Holliday junction resolvase RusA-like endonuclease
MKTMDERKWIIKIPGQPPTVNHMYKEATHQAKDKLGNPVYWPNGKPKMFRTKVKGDGVQAYQDSVTWYTKAAVPSKWEPSERVRLRYWMHLKRDIDADNLKKAINDAIAHGLRIDDRIFLTTDEAKWTGEKDPFVLVEVENERQPGHDDSHHRIGSTTSK